MKKNYDFPEMTVIRFEEDIITTSSGIDENELPYMPFSDTLEGWL